MKKSLYAYLTIILVSVLFTTITYTACKKDKCKNLTCMNGGVCKDGSCNCTTGYSGDKCDATVREGYYKTYAGEGQDSDGDKYPKSKLKFSKNGDDVKSLKLDIYDQNEILVNSFEVTLTTNSTYNLVNKTEQSNTYEGTGTISAGTASLKMSVTSGGKKLDIDFPSMTAQ